ncbi:hypothetical protein CISIN_1g035396mg [Citrus sinensis]|uniref:Uncharacterized protein n=1 Tax=Citrus sinensis TaxID=2711 RepID=A0A067DC74_CITSI|nr:hypothetical protein CISIN_1g035396mg [Citrus sinensis]
MFLTMVSVGQSLLMVLLEAFLWRVLKIINSMDQSCKDWCLMILDAEEG